MKKKLTKVEEAVMQLAYRLENVAGGKIQEEILKIIRPLPNKKKKHV